MTARFRVHIENETKLMPVFTVYPNQYEAALGRHAEVSKFVDTTWGIDGDVFERAITDADALIGYRFPRAHLAERAPKLKFVQVLGAGVDYMLPFDWVPRGLTLTNNCGAHVPKAAQSGLMAILMANAQVPKLVTSQRRREWNRIFTLDRIRQDAADCGCRAYRRRNCGAGETTWNASARRTAQ